MTVPTSPSPWQPHLPQKTGGGFQAKLSVKEPHLDHMPDAAQTPLPWGRLHLRRELANVLLQAPTTHWHQNLCPGLNCPHEGHRHTHTRDQAEEEPVALSLGSGRSRAAARCWRAPADSPAPADPGGGPQQSLAAPTPALSTRALGLRQLRKHPSAPCSSITLCGIRLCWEGSCRERRAAGTRSAIACPFLPPLLSEQPQLSEIPHFTGEEKCPSGCPRLPPLRLAALSRCQYFDTKHRGVCVLSLVKRQSY